MPWSNGVYTRSNGVFTGATVWASDASVGTNITTSHHDTHDQDIATGLNNCVTVDGLNQIAANFVSTADGAYNLGSASFRWGNAYFAGNVTGGTYVNSTLASPTLSGTVIGTYTLGGTPTITSPTIATPTITNPTITNPTITNPTINGNSVINAAQGRLSLTSTTPVQITDVSAAQQFTTCRIVGLWYRATTVPISWISISVPVSDRS